VNAREDYIKGLRDLADWLEANPAAPLGNFDSAHLQYTAPTDTDRDTVMRELDGAAAALGLEAGLMFGGDPKYYGFHVTFGPVRYQAVSIADRNDEDEQPGGGS
jgi:hypothetical protein